MRMFQDVFLRHGGAEQTFMAAAEGGGGPITVGMASPAGLRRVQELGQDVETVFVHTPGERAPYSTLTVVVEALLALPRFDGEILAFHHHFGLLLSGMQRTHYYLHTPTRVLHEPRRAPWELAVLDETTRERMRVRELSNIHAAARVIVNSAATAARARRAYDVPCSIAHPPTELWRREAQSTVDEPRRPYVLTVSRLSKSKGLLKAAPEVILSGFRWLVVGDGDADVIRELENVGDQVELLGPRDDTHVAQLIKNASVCLSPALEDFGLFAAEAMTFGRPVVAHAGSGVFDLAHLGVLVPFGPEHGSLREAIFSAAGAPSPRWKGVEKLRHHLSRRAFRERLSEVLARS